MHRATPHCAAVEGGSFLSPFLRAACVGFTYLEPLRGWRTAGTVALRQKHIERYFLPFADNRYPKSKAHSLKSNGHSLKSRALSLKGKGHSLKSKGHSLKSKGHSLKSKGHSLKSKALSLKGKGHSLKGKARSLKSKSHVLKSKAHNPKSKVRNSGLPWSGYGKPLLPQARDAAGALAG